MAYVVSSIVTTQAPAGTSFTPELPAHQTNDLLLVEIANDGGGTAIVAPAGWTIIGTQAASGASRTVFAYKVAASSAEADPTFTGANDDFVGIATVIREADTTTPIHGSAMADYTGTTTSASPALTTTNNECLLIYGWGSDGTVGAKVPMGDLSFVNYGASGSALTAVCGWINQYTAGAVPSVTMTRTSSTNGGNAWVIAVNNKSAGGLRGECVNICDVTRLYGTGFEAGTYSAPNSVTGLTDIDGQTSFYTAIDISDTSVYGATITNSIDTNSWVGGFDTFAAKNLSGALLSVRWRAPATINGRVKPRGFIMVLVDSLNNWKAFTLAKNKYSQILISNTYVSFIDLDGGTVLDSGGAFNSADVVKFGFLYERMSGSTSAAAFSINPVFKHGGMVFAGGNNDTPATPADIEFSSAEGPALTALGFNGIQALCDLQGSQQLILPVSCQFGDGGTTPTYLQFSGASIETPLPYTENYLWNVAASKITLTLYAGASDTFDLSAAVLRANSKQAFTLHASSSTSATYNFTGASFIGWDVTWKTGIACSGATFDGCYEIAAKGANFTNCTIKNTASTDAAIAFDASGATMDGCTIDVTGTSAAYHLEMGASCTSITLTDVTFTGTPGTDKVHVLATAGTVTITISGTTNLVAADVTSAGATVVIASPAIYQTVTISSATAGSRIQIYDTTSSTELYNGTPTFPYTWTDSVAASANRAIRLRCTYVSGATAKDMIEASIGTCGTTSSTKDVSYVVNQTADSVYNNNAIDGSTVTNITINDTTNLVSINVSAGSVSYPQIYAYQVYWLNTATGIQDDFAFISAPDTANYIFTGFKIKNVTSPSVPLKITGGYGRDATSGLVADIIDTTGGNVYPSPDHVVSYATGSGVTAQDKVDIASGVWGNTSRTLTQTIPTATQNADAVWAKTLP